MKQVWKKGGGIEMSTTVLHSRCSLLRLNTYHVSMAWKRFDGMHFSNASAFFDSMHQHGGLVAIQLLTYAPRTTARHILIGVGHQITRWTPSTWFAVLLRTWIFFVLIFVVAQASTVCINSVQISKRKQTRRTKGSFSLARRFQQRQLQILQDCGWLVVLQQMERCTFRNVKSYSPRVPIDLIWALSVN